MELQDLKNRIESLRQLMIEEAINQGGSFTHEDVLTISQKLDKYIVRYQKIKCAKLIYHAKGLSISSY